MKITNLQGLWKKLDRACSNNRTTAVHKTNVGSKAKTNHEIVKNKNLSYFYSTKKMVLTISTF